MEHPVVVYVLFVSIPKSGIFKSLSLPTTVVKFFSSFREEAFHRTSVVRCVGFYKMMTLEKRLRFNIGKYVLLRKSKTIRN